MDTIYRWIAEGHLSVLNRKVFLPKEAIVKGELKRIFDVKAWSSQGQKTCLLQLCKLLGISSIPVPNLITLATRFCKELQLPGEVCLCIMITGILNYKDNFLLDVSSITINGILMRKFCIS